MNTIDLIISAVLILGSVRGFFKGFFVEVTSVLGLFLGVYISISFNSEATTLIAKIYSGNTDYIEVIAFALTFIAVLLVVNAIGKILTKIANFSALGLVNKLAGTLFGFLKSGLILCVLTMIVLKINTHFTLISEETLENSVMFSYLEQMSIMLWKGIGDYEALIPGAIS